MWLLTSQRDLPWLASSTFLLSFSHRIFTAVFVLYAGHRYGLSIMQVGALLAASGVMDLVVQGGMVGPAIRQFGERRVMFFGFVWGAIGLAAMAFAPSAWLFALALVPNSLWGLSEPTLKAMMSARVDQAEQGRLQGAAHCVSSMAGITGPLFFGWVYGLSSLSVPGLVFVIAAGIVLLAAGFGAMAGRPQGSATA